METVQRMVSADGSVKRLHRLDDGEVVESVVIPHTTKTNMCISTQAGCRMRCTFCATGKRFARHLTADEIVGQVDEPVDSLVFMGMGEPLDNPNLIEAIERIKKEKGIASRKIVVSTVGLCDQVEKLLPTKVNIAFSVHATTDEQRSKIMPINRKFPIAVLKNTMRELDVKLPSSRRLQIQYIMIKGFNDTPDDAKRLAELVPKNSLINLIPYNDTGAGFEPSAQEAIEIFKSEMRKHGFICYVREPRGRDVAGACGMLAGAPKPAQK